MRTIPGERWSGPPLEPETLGYGMGLDLGQASDYTALVVVEAVSVLTGEPETVQEDAILAAFAHRPPRTFTRPGRRIEHHVVHLERMRGKPYPEIVARTGDVVEQVIANHRIKVTLPPGHDPLIQRTPDPPLPLLMVDATGVGRPVLDMVRQAGMPAEIRGATITGGDAVTTEGWDVRVPKRDLVSAVLRLLQEGRLKWGVRLPLRAELEAELRTFRARITPAAHEVYGAWREGEHDDLVLALALACWGLEFVPGAPVG
ncbi:MAG: hypothetical protein M3Q71_05715 [Chloroflexota bacterium]|nr:hypothetical protein [Chloroflexota bacterium]